MVYFVRGEDCRELLGGSPTLANLGNDHEFISKEYISIGMRPFGEAQSKAMRAYAQSGQYHTVVLWRVVIPNKPYHEGHLNRRKRHSSYIFGLREKYVYLQSCIHCYK